MATCPRNNKDWAPLVDEMQGNRMKAFSAFYHNGGEVPALDSEIVKAIKELDIEYGPEIKVQTDEEGNETGFYEKEDKTTLNRSTDYINGFLRFFNPFKKEKHQFATDGQEKAEVRYNGLDEGSTLINKYNGKPQTKDEYAEYMNGMFEAYRVKGNAIHKGIQAVLTPSKKDELYASIESEIEDFNYEYGDEFSINWEWVKDEKVVKTMLKNIGVNTFMVTKAEDDVIKDIVHSEVKIANDLLGFGGTIDTLIEKGNGRLSISDWKTGGSYNPTNSDMGAIMMRYGNTPTKEVLLNPMNQSKLQVMFYAMMMKLNNPKYEFENLTVSWVPDKYRANDSGNVESIDVKAYLTMIETFFKDKEAVKEAGYPADIYEQLIAASPNVFNPSHYTNNISEKLADRIIKEETTPENAFQDNLLKLSALVGSNYAMSKNIKSKTELLELSKSEREEVFEYNKEILQLLSDGSLDMSNLTHGEDMNFLTAWIGNMADVNNPLVQEYKKFHDKQLRLKHLKKLEYQHKFQSLLTPVLEKAKRETFGIRGNRNYNYEKIYGKFFVNESVDRHSGMEERFLHNEEEDPELKARYEALTLDEKKLLNFMNETFASFFDENSYSNKLAYEKASGKPVTHLDAANEGKQPEDKFNYVKGFFFKVPIEHREIKERFGWEKAIRTFFKYNLTYFREDAYEGESDKYQAIPYKYLGNKYINGTQLYTKNLENIFMNGVESVLHKEHMDQVFAVGSGINAFLKSGELADKYTNLSNFLNHKIITNVQGKMVRTKWSRRGIKYTNKSKQEYIMSVDKMLSLATNWTSMTTMWLKPFQGAGNGAHATLLTHRDAIKGLITDKMEGFDSAGIDFTYKDLLRAEYEYKNVIKDTAFGNIRKNKMMLMAQKFDYFGNNFDYATMDKFILSQKNKYFDQGTFYLFHSIPEEFVSLTTMAAQMMHTKDSKGRSLWDMYEPKEVSPGVWDLVWTGGVRAKVKRGSGVATWYEDLTEPDTQEIYKMKRVHERLQGGYRKEESIALEAYAIGKAAIQFKKYLPRLIINIFHGRKISTDLGYYKQLFDSEGRPVYIQENGEKISVMEWHARVEEGRLRSIGIALNVLIGRKSKSEMIDVTKENLVESVVTLSMLAFFYSIYAFVFSDTDDDDTMKKWWKMYLVDNLSQQYNPIDLLRSLETAATPVVLTKLSNSAEAFWTMGVATTNYAQGNEDAAFTKQGDLRGWNMFKKNVPLLASFSDLLSKMEHNKSGEEFMKGLDDGFRLK